MLKHALFALVIMCLTVGASAPIRAQQPMSEKKRALILELVEIYNQQTSPSQVVDAMLAQMQVSFPQMLGDLVTDRTDLTATQKEEIRKEANAIFERFSTRYREEVGRQIDFRKFQEEVSLSLYDKYFTEGELADMIAYYRTPTGQKALRLMPELLADSVRQSAEILGPQLTRIARQILQEELGNLKPKPAGSRRGRPAQRN